MPSFDRIADAIVREVPVSNIPALLKGLNDPTSPLANGGGCGQGCGAGCMAPLGLHFDEFGHSGINTADLIEAAKDQAGLLAAVKASIAKSL